MKLNWTSFILLNNWLETYEATVTSPGYDVGPDAGIASLGRAMSGVVQLAPG